MSTSETVSFGDLLRRHRLAATLSQEALAERAGLSGDAIRALERGRRTAPRPETIALLMDALALLPDDRNAFVAAGTRSSSVGMATSPAARTLSELSVPPTALIGREREEASVVHLLRRERGRLVTLIGPGGVGKTRLALQVVATLQTDYSDGAAFVDLAPVRDPALAPSAIAKAVGMREVGSQSARDALLAYLRDRQLLLVLDNFEQVLDAAPVVTALLSHCPLLTILTTSRAALGVRAEQRFPVSPLATPDPRRPVILAEVAGYAAVQLFVARAQAVLPSFALDAENASAVAAICQRLDGLPLAIELAAARSALLPSQALLARLSSRLGLLTGGARDLPDRQRTLRATIEWSYDLLDDGERRLFGQLAAFAGGWTLAAAEAVCVTAEGSSAPSLGMDVLNILHSLIDKSLVRRIEAADDAPRFTMLETIREYGLECLATRDGEAMLRRHAAFFLTLAERAGAALGGDGHVAWLDRLETEHENLRAALHWFIRRGHDPVAGVQLAGSLAPFWEARGYLREGRAWLEEALQASSPEEYALRARALGGAGRLAFRQGDHDAAQALLAESLMLARRVGDDHLAAHALFNLGNVAWQHGDLATADALCEESLALARRAGDRGTIAHVLGRLGGIAWDHGTYARSRTLLEESLALRRQQGDRQQIAHSLYSLGHVAWTQGDWGAAEAYDAESLALARELGETQAIAHALNNLGLVARATGNHPAAQAYLEDCLAISRETGDQWLQTFALAWLGYVVQERGDTEQAAAYFAESLTVARQRGMTRAIALALAGLAGGEGLSARSMPGARRDLALQRAVQLFGATQTLLNASMLHLDPEDDRAFANNIRAVRAELDETAFDAAWTMGCAMPLEQALDLALRPLPYHASSAVLPHDSHHDLSAQSV